MSNQSERTIQSSDRTFEIVEEIRESNGMRIAELAEELDLAKSTIHNHLSTLKKYGYVVNEGGTYHIGLKFLNLGRHARKRKKSGIAMDQWVEELSEKTSEGVDFVVEEHGLGVQLYHDLKTLNSRTQNRMGQFYYLHATAAGKAILSELPRSYVDQILDKRGLPRQTPNTITSRETLYNRLEKSRERGYALNDEESTTGLRAVASPILMPNGSVFGSISVTGPTYRITVDDLHDISDSIMEIKRNMNDRN